LAEHVILVFVDEPFASQSLVDLRRLERVARRVLEAEGTPSCELSVAVMGDDSVRQMNRDFAGEDAVTDVLSFSQREGEEFAAPPEGVPPLGEVVIAYPQAERQAAERTGDVSEGKALREPQGERGWSVEREIEWLLVHGVLHLLGYDHAEPEEARRMRTREEALVNG